MTSTFLYDLCLPVTIYLESESFEADTGWIVGAFFLGLLVGGGITAILAPICMRDWQKKKRQDEEEAMLIEMEKDSAVTATNIDDDIMVADVDKRKDKTAVKPGRLSFITSRLKLGRKKDQPPAKTSGNVKTGWVQSEGDGRTKQPEMKEQGMVTVLLDPKGNADAELTNQDMTAIKKLDKDQKKTKDDMMLKMLKIKLRKMKGKGQINDPYLAEFTQKIIDNKRNNEEVLNAEKTDAEDEIRKRLAKNPKAMDEELENLDVNHGLKLNQIEKDELENIRGELLRSSGLSESEVDDLLERLKQDMAELERKQGLEQARQARHLAERLEKRRHIVEFRKLQEQQNQQQMLAEVHAFEQPIVDNLVKDGKLTEKQKEEILNEHEKNLQNLQKQHEIDSMRMQSDLAEKLEKRRETRMRKLEDKHQRERANYLDKAESGSKADDFINTFQDLIQRQQVETEEVQNELDQTEIQEIEKQNNNLDQKKTKDVKMQTEKFIQTLKTTGQTTDYDVNKIIKLHNARMDEFDARRRMEKERMRKNLQEKWEQRMMKLEEETQRANTEKEAIMEQQASTVKRVLDSNLELSDDAREKIMREHERNMEALNNQLSRSKLKQQLSLEQKLSQRKARLEAIRSQQELAKQQRKELTEKELRQMQEKLDHEILLFEKERKEAEEALRKRLALETEAALVQQERDLTALIGRLEVGHARRQAVLQKQDKTMKQLQDQLENKIQDGRLSANRADQIIQQHYNQVEHINDQLQQNRDRQERLINEKIQAKKYRLQRELEDELAKERQEVMMARRQAGAGMASAILNNSLMEQRQKKAMEELEKEMQIELERNKEQLNNELQLALEKELQNHKGDFLNQLAAASNLSRQEIDDVVSNAAMDTGRNRTDARKLSKSLTMDVEKAKTSLGMIEEDDSDNVYNREKPRPVSRPRSSLRKAEYDPYEREEELRPVSGKRKTLQKSKPAFSTSTGEQVHGAWDLDELL